MPDEKPGFTIGHTTIHGLSLALGLQAGFWLGGAVASGLAGRAFDALIGKLATQRGWRFTPTVAKRDAERTVSAEEYERMQRHNADVESAATSLQDRYPEIAHHLRGLAVKEPDAIVFRRDKLAATG